MRLPNFLAVIATLSFAPASLPPAMAHGDLTLVTFGGVFTRSLMRAHVRPFETRTGHDLEVLDYTGGLREVRAQVESENVKWDLVDLDPNELIEACEEGLLERIDPAILPPGADGTPAMEDILDGALHECGVSQIIFSSVIGYDARAFSNNPPDGIADFFDVVRYPGPRGLRRAPTVNLEWALLADGVAPDKVYEVLATPEGVDRAFSQLNRLKPNIVWWQDPADAPRFLEQGQVTMTTVWNARIERLVEGRPEDFGMFWTDQIWRMQYWVIPKGSENKDLALEFLAFMTGSERLAEQMRHISLGPSRQSALALVPPGMLSRLPTAPDNMERAFRFDAAWWARHQDTLIPRFEAWSAAIQPSLGDIAR